VKADREQGRPQGAALFHWGNGLALADRREMVYEHAGNRPCGHPGAARRAAVLVAVWRVLFGCTDYTMAIMTIGRSSLVCVAVFTAATAWGQTSRPAAADDLERLDFRRVVADAKAKVFPAVIFIKCIRENLESGKKMSEEVAGSGVIISPTGEALTNWHVVDKAVDIRCLLYDGRAMDAKLIGTDKDTDLALIQFAVPNGGGALPYSSFGDSTKLKEGDFVMAMGAPWGMARSVSIGIVSCTRRFLPEHSEYSLWLQTDASISPGNSGGPLVNTTGETIGINTRGEMMGGDLGFAIPSDTIKVIVSQLRDQHEVNWSWTGLQLQPLHDFNRNTYFDATEGVIVAETDPESPARQAGILPKDRIVAIGGKSVTAMTEEDLPALRREIGLLPKGAPVKIELMRNDQSLTVELSPRKKGKVEGEELDCPRWDFTVKAVNQFDNPQLYFHRKEGVFVYGIKYPGNASTSGLEREDIILEIDGKAVKTLDDVKALHKAAVDNVEKKHRIVFTVLRDGLRRQVVLDFSRDYEKE
jgi:serine protease Do